MSGAKFSFGPVNMVKLRPVIILIRTLYCFYFILQPRCYAAWKQLMQEECVFVMTKEPMSTIQSMVLNVKVSKA